MNKIKISSNQNIIKEYFGDKTQSEILLQENINFNYLCLGSDSDLNIDFYTKGENIVGNIYAIFFGKSRISANIVSHINHSNCHINMFFLSFLNNNNDILVNGCVNLGKNIFQSQGHLLQKNIILGDKVNIRSIPRLDVYSNDVKASHGLSIDRINSDEMFYLNSKGLDESISKEMIIRGNINNILNQFEDLSDAQKNEIENKIIANNYKL